MRPVPCLVGWCRVGSSWTGAQSYATELTAKGRTPGCKSNAASLGTQTCRMKLKKQRLLAVVQGKSQVGFVWHRARDSNPVDEVVRRGG